MASPEDHSDSHVLHVTAYRFSLAYTADQIQRPVQQEPLLLSTSFQTVVVMLLVPLQICTSYTLQSSACNRSLQVWV